MEFLLLYLYGYFIFQIKTLMSVSQLNYGSSLAFYDNSKDQINRPQEENSWGR